MFHLSHRPLQTKSRIHNRTPRDFCLKPNCVYEENASGYVYEEGLFKVREGGNGVSQLILLPWRLAPGRNYRVQGFCWMLITL